MKILAAQIFVQRAGCAVVDGKETFKRSRIYLYCTDICSRGRVCGLLQNFPPFTNLVWPISCILLYFTTPDKFDWRFILEQMYSLTVTHIFNILQYLITPYRQRFDFVWRLIYEHISSPHLLASFFISILKPPIALVLI